MHTCQSIQAPEILFREPGVLESLDGQELIKGKVEESELSITFIVT